jgi:eukaryotic-like serine/threonine-protein kinase
MDLWTEFEGVTIDSAFSLKKLLQTEGRSAFFSTLNAKGESVLIRLIECHFDEDEILARWRGIQTLGHPSFLRIDSFGQFRIEEDDITAVYAVFERVDANLGQVLERGRLSASDAAQIGVSIASALETLHAHGFVHEHIEARTIFAVGESVKLRSDCIRETPEGEAGLQARRRDVHDLALVLNEVLVGMPRAAYTSRQQTLPAPFDDIVRNGLSGEWGLAEINAALSNSKNAKGRPAATQGASAAATAKVRDLAARTFSSENATRPEPRPEPRREPSASPNPKSTERAGFRGRQSASFDLATLAGNSQHLFRRWIAAGVFLLIVLFLGWMFSHLFFGKRDATAAPSAAAPQSTAAASHAAPAPVQSGSRQAAPAARVSVRGRSDWRVVAFTYNREDQAQKKASSLAQKHPDLRPEVFSPNGRAPWLVTIGGVQQREAAYALAHKASSLGLPRDTYAQNYKVR